MPLTEYNRYKVCINSLYNCASACNNIVGYFIKQEKLNSPKTMKLLLECSIMCRFVAELLSLGSSKAKKVSKICAKACDDCATELMNFTEDQFKEAAGLCSECADHCAIIE